MSIVAIWKYSPFNLLSILHFLTRGDSCLIFYKNVIMKVECFSIIMASVAISSSLVKIANSASNTCLDIVAENIEALTKDYENKKINGITCNALELGRVPSLEEIVDFPDNYSFWNLPIETINEKQDFVVTATGAVESLLKCNTSSYKHGVELGTYCWLTLGDKNKYSKTGIPPRKMIKELK